MPNKNSQLLNATEILDVYGVPALNEFEIREYFTLNKDETKALKSFKDVENAVYFAASLVFFKIKQTLINFNYQDITNERRHIMERYFPRKKSPKKLPKSSNIIARIESKVLELCNYKRFSGSFSTKLIKELQQLAPHYPRQRQLCKVFLDLLTKNRVAIPGYSTIQDIISKVWNAENKSMIKSYLRYTNKSQRDGVLFLLNKTDDKHRIISIKQEMKGFNTTELQSETEKHDDLRPIFETAKDVLPKLRLPAATINYYASLINYYCGSRLKQIDINLAQLYLLCYCYTRYQVSNDNLLEAFKKRTLDYENAGYEYSKEQSLKQLDAIKDIRKRVSDMLIAIKNHPNKNSIPKNALYKHVPENELITAAKLLVDENFDKDFLFWKYIDSQEDSIILNLRKIFLTLDLVTTNNDILGSAIDYIKENLLNNSLQSTPLPHSLMSWAKKKGSEHLFYNGKIIHNRLEFFLYMQIVHHISTNKLNLKYTIKHKKVDDDLMPINKWGKHKKGLLKKLNYSKLTAPVQKTIKTKKDDLFELYNIVNENILNGKNQDIKITSSKDGKSRWKLRLLEAESDPNESVLANFQQRSIVDVTHFVNSKTNFIRAFESILPKSKKGEQDIAYIMAVVLANAIRIGSRKIADISDLNESSLLTTEASYIRTETLVAAINIINNAAAKLPIFKQWYIDGILHGSIDGMKLETRLRNILARHSSKYFGRGMGVSAYNEIVNSFSIAGRLIGANEYEGAFAFEMVHHQNTSDIKPTTISTDKHGTNALNFGLFELTDRVYAPRIPKPHNETFWGFGSAKDYDGFIIKPSRFFKEELFYDEWDNIQRLAASLITGEATPSIVIRKLSSGNYNSRTKKAFVQYNNIVKSQFLLMYLNIPEFRRAIMVALNRGEAYNNLYQAITVHKKAELRGQSEMEMEIWHQCTRLISSIMLYYNSYILNSLYMNASKAEREFLVTVSPSAWSHINLLGYYQFFGQFNDRIVEKFIRQWDWKKWS
ncbi:MAG: Tn3 family transposase [Gammaproteobacteria bacterium]|jgi:TnpA family transposase